MAPLNSLHARRPVFFGVADPHKSPTCGTSCSADTTQLILNTGVPCLKKNQTTPRPSEHPPVMGENMSKRLGGIKRLQIQNHFMTVKQVPRCS